MADDAALMSTLEVPPRLLELFSANMTRLLQVFARWDADGNGRVDRADFDKAMTALGIEIPQQDIAVIFRAMDETGDGFITLDELLVFKGLIERGQKTHVVTMKSNNVRRRARRVSLVLRASSILVSAMSKRASVQKARTRGAASSSSASTESADSE